MPSTAVVYRFCNGYYGYQLYFFCVCVFVMGSMGTEYVVYLGVAERFMGTTATNSISISCIRVWGSDLWVPRVPSILLLCGFFL